MKIDSERFRLHVAQVSEYDTLMIDVDRAEGIYVWDTSGRRYMDMLSGICVGNVGHRHPQVVAAVKDQVDRYMHVMVYGEFIQSPQLLYAEKLASCLSSSLSSFFFVNSGSEAIEGALKLARLYTRRPEVISMKTSYHGSTLGAVSMMSDDLFTAPFRPLIPGNKQITFNNEDDLMQITEQTACVVTEVIQSGGGVILPETGYLKKLRRRCQEVGTLLILDEIQTGFGRTGSLFAFQAEGIEPDILCIAKGMGGGMPIGAFVSSPGIMKSLDNGHPLIGHATTFGGHPVSCASALATLEVVLSDKLIANSIQKGERYRKELKHKHIKAIRGRGLFNAIELHDAALSLPILESCFRNGVITGTHLFNPACLSLKPPLIITEDQISESIEYIIKAFDSV